MFSSFFSIGAAFLILSVSNTIVQSQKCYMFVPTCPASWHQWGDSCYQVTEKIFTWVEAGEQCQKVGGVLAVPSNLQENDFMMTLISTNAWIGCDDIEIEGEWECREGDLVVTYRNWDSWQGERSRYGGSEDCAAFSKLYGSKRQWHDFPCGYPSPAVCKKPADSYLQPLP